VPAAVKNGATAKLQDYITTAGSHPAVVCPVLHISCISTYASSTAALDTALLVLHHHPASQRHLQQAPVQSLNSCTLCLPPSLYVRFESGIDVDDEVVLMTTKGEAVAVGIATMNSAGMASVDHGSVSKIKRVIMERDTYPRRCVILSLGLGLYILAQHLHVDAGLGITWMCFSQMDEFVCCVDTGVRQLRSAAGRSASCALMYVLLVKRSECVWHAQTSLCSTY
jgi:hypothetical protein